MLLVSSWASPEMGQTSTDPDVATPAVVDVDDVAVRWIGATNPVGGVLLDRRTAIPGWPFTFARMVTGVVQPTVVVTSIILRVGNADRFTIPRCHLAGSRTIAWSRPRTGTWAPGTSGIRSGRAPTRAPIHAAWRSAKACAVFHAGVSEMPR